ncbi:MULTISPECIES: DNA helicase RecQ [Megasphaera]|uniref:DNA helicase RecQ n=1 Tax=Megasphaera elsdenii TaxID=907 RepID=A0A1M6QZF0_MEGEL|nr:MULTISPECIES: DNA helicase RecQ [Megasphaera]AVO26238.1 DNA helicase RecQ [Megasphaera elsdenii]MCI6924259.1 DNA helicase RecQ [Megasphaera elsdenii]MCI7059264.1 DNA helicase RecQ [Megasphaera elsdenii]MDD7069544.1 DNA helicase RecQ [Megasphaera elsdenii]MDY5215184.1 DNA helicase RecQ [Megasphaera elsdenii]
MELESLLKQYFGYTSFRPGQHEVIQTLLEGRDCLAIMPTGAGKSICFQLPALMMPGVTLVISPLISLMKDQVDSLVNQEIPATYINSQCTFEEAKARFAAIRAGRVKLVYISPERLENEFFTSFMQSLPISMFIIDEAHCVSQWGHDFRPSYCAIKDWIAALPRRPVVGAFTATATEKVKEDMMTLLGLEKERIFIGGFDRPNLYFRVVRTNRKLDFALAYVQQHQEDSGIIYAATRKEVDRVYEELTRRGIRAGRYHAGLSDDVRRTMQDAFTYDRLQVIVATNAFGMGIDKSNVRYVIHYQMPKNIESYYQEAGRAGRDGAPGECILLFSRQDIMIQKFLIEQSVHDPQQQAVEFRLLNAMVRYCEGNHCLRHYILTYFGEHPSWQRCEKCGNCDQETVEEDMTEQVRSICLCVDELKGRFGMTMVCDILKGSQNAKVRRYGFENNSAFGMLGDFTLSEVRDMVRQCIDDGYLDQSDGKYPVVSLTADGRQALSGSRRIVQQKVVAADPVPELPKRQQKRRAGAIDEDALRPLFDTLRAVRLELAKDEHIPPFVIFSDATLWDMAALKPDSLDAMSQIKGVGSFKLHKYGRQFVGAIQSYIDNH